MSLLPHADRRLYDIIVNHTYPLLPHADRRPYEHNSQ